MLRSEWVGLEIDDRYTLLEWLGSTASGDAYLTALPEGPRAVLLLTQADPANAQDQLRNWQRATELDHPHLLRALACGRTEVEGVDCLYFVTEVPEEALAEILPERALTVEEVREMLGPILNALGHLHEHNLLHGRLDPASILVAEGRLKLATDGVRPAGSLRGFDDVLTIFDAPESKSEPLSPAADVWSLGITLVETLTQKAPAWMRSSGRDPLIPDSVPQPFAEIARQCLRTDPAQRCTIAHIIGILEPTIPEAAPPAEPAETVPEPIPALLVELPSPALEGEPLPHRPATPRQHISKPLAPAPEQLDMFEGAASSAAVPVEDTASQPFRRAMRGLDTDDEPAITPRRYLQIGIAAAVILLLLIFGWAAYHHKGGVKTAAVPEQAQPQAPSRESAPLPASQRPGPQKELSQKTIPERLSEPARPRTHAATTRGEVLSRVVPAIPARSSRGIHGKVEVKVRASVDHYGNVTSVSGKSAGRNRYFSEKSVDAARKWKFKPARVDGRAASSTWELRFIFRKGRTEALAAEVTP